MKTGLALVEDISARKVASGSFAFWWLGQHSFVVKTASKTIYLDPFLSPHARRMVPSPLNPEEALHADLITGSHDHTDHIDHAALPAIMTASPKAKLLVPRTAISRLQKEGLDMARIIAMDDGAVYEDKGLKITALKSAHELFHRDEQLGYPFLGFVVEADGVALYHSGDTCDYDGLAERLRNWNLTAAFLPINGRDAVRLKSGCIGNMTYQEAVDLAGSIKLKTVVPSHFGMFASNTENPQLFIDYLGVKYPHLRCAAPFFGEAVELS